MVLNDSDDQLIMRELGFSKMGYRSTIIQEQAAIGAAASSTVFDLVAVSRSLQTNPATWLSLCSPTVSLIAGRPGGNELLQHFIERDGGVWMTECPGPNGTILSITI
jgi:hypothetical protein